MRVIRASEGRSLRRIEFVIVEGRIEGLPYVSSP